MEIIQEQTCFVGPFRSELFWNKWMICHHVTECLDQPCQNSLPFEQQVLDNTREDLFIKFILILNITLVSPLHIVTQQLLFSAFVHACFRTVTISHSIITPCLCESFKWSILSSTSKHWFYFFFQQVNFLNWFSMYYNCTVLLPVHAATPIHSLVQNQGRG